VSNGIPGEQALIRRWWHEQHDAHGRIVWEYHLEGFYADALWLPDEPGRDQESPGKNTAHLYPLADRRVVLCGAKLRLTPELVGQALVYAALIRETGAILAETIIFCATGSPRMQEVARSLGLGVVVLS